MPRQVIITTVSLTIFAAILGFWLGTHREPLNETHVISGVIDVYMRDHQGAATDCVAIPAPHPLWLQVICGSVTYDIDPRGRIVDETGPQI